MTVRELIAHLQTGDQDAEVVVFDHFGQPIELHEFDFDFMRRTHYPKAVDIPKDKQWFLGVRAVDIGPEPD